MGPIRNGQRHERADARRNRQRILAAARSIFAERGAEAQMDEVAASAGVGVGTLYRRFLTKEALLDELVAEKFALSAEAARHAMEITDPWEAFATAIRCAAELMARDLALQQALQGNSASKRADEHRIALLTAVDALISRAQQAGVLRNDVSIEDMPMFMAGLSSAMTAEGGKGEAWRRWLEIMLDGLRQPRTGPPPP